GGDLAQAELVPDAADFLGNSLAQHQLVAGGRVAPRALGVELDFAAGSTAPAREALHPRRHAGMLDGEALALEARHALLGFAAQALPRHGSSLLELDHR